MTLIQRRLNVDATSWRCIDVEATLYQCHVPAGILNLHWNGDVFNQRFVISPWTGVLHACLSPKRQNPTTFASGEKRIFVTYSLKGLQFKSDYMRDEVDLNRPSLNIANVPKCQHYFNGHPPSTPSKLTLRNYLRKILRFSIHNSVLRVWRWAAVKMITLIFF